MDLDLAILLLLFAAFAVGTVKPAETVRLAPAPYTIDNAPW